MRGLKKFLIPRKTTVCVFSCEGHNGLILASSVASRHSSSVSRVRALAFFSSAQERGEMGETYLYRRNCRGIVKGVRNIPDAL